MHLHAITVQQCTFTVGVACSLLYCQPSACTRPVPWLRRVCMWTMSPEGPEVAFIDLWRTRHLAISYGTMVPDEFLIHLGYFNHSVLIPFITFQSLRSLWLLL